MRWPWVRRDDFENAVAACKARQKKIDDLERKVKILEGGIEKAKAELQRAMPEFTVTTNFTACAAPTPAEET